MRGAEVASSRAVVNTNATGAGAGAGVELRPATATSGFDFEVVEEKKADDPTAHV